jgi:hypothetical protein
MHIFRHVGQIMKLCSRAPVPRLVVFNDVLVFYDDTFRLPQNGNAVPHGTQVRWPLRLFITASDL